jgi:dTDP-glucose 4,6-dehydratase
MIIRFSKSEISYIRLSNPHRAQDASAFVKTNVLGTHALLERAREQELHRFVQIGTDDVYGSTTSRSFYEDDSLNPSSPYSASKAGADLLARAYFITYGLPVMVTRSCNNFGPYQYPEKLIPFFILGPCAGKHFLSMARD